MVNAQCSCRRSMREVSQRRQQGVRPAESEAARGTDCCCHTPWPGLPLRPDGRARMRPTSLAHSRILVLFLPLSRSLKLFPSSLLTRHLVSSHLTSNGSSGCQLILTTPLQQRSSPHTLELRLSAIAHSPFAAHGDQARTTQAARSRRLAATHPPQHWTERISSFAPFGSV
jgi:hypothetical protein